MSAVVRLYAPALVFATWAVVRAFGAHADLVSAAFLAATAVALVVSEQQRRKLYAAE